MTSSLGPEARARLRRLLLSAFDASELRRLVRYLPDGETLSYGLPTGAVTPAQLVEGVIDAVERADDTGAGIGHLLRAIRQERPRRAAEVDAVLGAPPPAPVTPPPPAADGYRYDVFLAHGSPDTPRVRPLYHLLRDQGLRCFFDEASLEPGANWMREIPEALAGSRIVVALISTAMAASWYANSEIAGAIQHARERSLRIVPVYLDGWLKPVPYGLEALHGLNAADLGLEEVARRLVELARRPSRDGAP